MAAALPMHPPFPGERGREPRGIKGTWGSLKAQPGRERLEEVPGGGLALPPRLRALNPNYCHPRLNSARQSWGQAGLNEASPVAGEPEGRLGVRGAGRRL